MKKLKDIPYQITYYLEHIDTTSYLFQDNHSEWIDGFHSYFNYKTTVTLQKVESFLGGKVTDIFSVKIAQRYNEYSLDSDWLFVFQKEDGSIEGTFAHCNYKMVWEGVQAFVSYLEKEEEERSNLLGEDEHNRLCEEEEEV